MTEFLPTRRGFVAAFIAACVVAAIFLTTRAATGLDTVPTDLPHIVIAEPTQPAGSASASDVPAVPNVEPMPTSTVPAPVVTVPVSVPTPTVQPTVSTTQQTVAPVDALGNDAATGMAPCLNEDSSTDGAWFPCVFRSVNGPGPVERIEYTYSGGIKYWADGTVEVFPIFFDADGQVLSFDWLPVGSFASCYGPCPVADPDVDVTHLVGPPCDSEDEIGCVFLSDAMDSAVPNEATPFQSCVSADRETLIPATAYGAGEPEPIPDPSLIVDDPIVCGEGFAD